MALPGNSTAAASPPVRPGLRSSCENGTLKSINLASRRDQVNQAGDLELRAGLLAG